MRMIVGGIEKFCAACLGELTSHPTITVCDSVQKGEGYGNGTGGTSHGKDSARIILH